MRWWVRRRIGRGRRELVRWSGWEFRMRWCIVRRWILERMCWRKKHKVRTRINKAIFWVIGFIVRRKEKGRGYSDDSDAFLDWLIFPDKREKERAIWDRASRSINSAQRTEGTEESTQVWETYIKRYRRIWWRNCTFHFLVLARKLNILRSFLE